MNNFSLAKILKDLLQDNEECDELGFTPSDYYDMQKLKDREGKMNDALLGGFDISSEQIDLINNKLHPFHSVAVICFYDVNYSLLRRMAYRFLTLTNESLKSVVSYEDLLQQLFVDLLSGFLKFSFDFKQIRSAIYNCFKFAAVGGLGVLKNVV